MNNQIVTILNADKKSTEINNIMNYIQYTYHHTVYIHKNSKLYSPKVTHNIKFTKTD